MKYIVSYLFLFVSVSLFSQSKTLTVLDSLSLKPIDLVHISYPYLAIGSVSNEDGKIKINLKNEDLLISHINYVEKQLPYEVLQKVDTIYLQSKVNLLEEIVVYNIDLKKKLSFVLENYHKLYYTKSLLKECTYKESFKVNDSLTRLFQIQLNWWSKHNLFNPKKSFKKENKLSIENVDYSKVKITDNLVGKGYIANSDFFRMIQLNFLISILTNNAEIVFISSVQKNKLTTAITFDADYIAKNKKVFSYKNSTIVFDSKSGAINHIKLNTTYYTDFKKKESRKKKLFYESRTVSHSEELSFQKLRNGKLILNYFVSVVKAEIKENNKEYEVIGSQKLFVTKTVKKKKFISKEIDLDKPFYESVSKNSFKRSKILLSKKEEAFIK